MSRINFFAVTIAACLMASPAAHAVGSCEKPVTVSVPDSASKLSVEGFSAIKADGDAYMDKARDYLSCLESIIYEYPPENPIVNQAGQAHQDYAKEWGPVWGELNMACVNWEMNHSTAFPGGCQPSVPTEG